MERMRNKHTDGFMIEAWKNLINEKHFTLLLNKYISRYAMVSYIKIWFFEKRLLRGFTPQGNPR